jgi:predicted small metal-binding protein
MARQYIDCRTIAKDSKCSVTIAADSEQELMEVAIGHAVAQHGHQDTPEFRNQLRQAIREGNPPA